MTPLETVELAERLAREPDPSLSGLWPRCVAVLTRQAIEAAATRCVLSAYGVEPRTLRMRLFLLRKALQEEDLARRAAWTWAALSDACHHHGYELAPSPHDLSTWLATARALALRVEEEHPTG